MAMNLKEVIGEIANDARTDIATVCQVLIVTAMRMGRNAANQGNENLLRDAAATNMELQAKLLRCRQVMEANDPGNALDIFGPPSIPPKGDEPPPDAAAAAPPSGSPTLPT